MVKRNIVELLAGMTPALIPISTLRVATAVGDSTVTITPTLTTDGRSRFVRGGRVSFHDATGESIWTIREVSADGGTLTLRTFPNVGLTGLVAPHPVGTPIYTNLLPYGPWDASGALSLGDPLLSVTVKRKQLVRHKDGRHIFPLYTVWIQSNRQLNWEDDSLDNESWAKQQEERTLSDLEAIEALLLSNTTLSSDLSDPVAEKLGGLSAEPATELIFGPNEIAVGETWHYVGICQVLVLARGRSTAP